MDNSGSAALALDELRTAVQLTPAEHALAESLVLYGAGFYGESPLLDDEAAS